MMLYITTTDGRHVLILEPSNIEKMKAGTPAITPDKKVTVAYCPDMEWLQGQIRQASITENITQEVLDRLLNEGLTKPEKIRTPIATEPAHDKHD